MRGAEKRFMEKIDAKIFQTISEYIVEQYLEGLKWTKVHSLTLFTSFPYTGAPNWSKAYRFLMADDLAALATLRVKYSCN